MLLNKEQKCVCLKIKQNDKDLSKCDSWLLLELLEFLKVLSYKWVGLIYSHF